MSRTLSTTGYQAITAADTDAVFVHLLKITPSAGSIICLTDNSANVIYNGDLYTSFPFSIVLPTSETGQIEEAKVIIDNVSRLLVDEVRTLTESLAVDIYVVDAAQAPVTLEASFTGFKLKNITYDAFTLSGRLTIEDYLGEPWPKDILSGANFPGLF